MSCMDLLGLYEPYRGSLVSFVDLSLVRRRDLTAEMMHSVLGDSGFEERSWLEPYLVRGNNRQNHYPP